MSLTMYGVPSRSNLPPYEHRTTSNGTSTRTYSGMGLANSSVAPRTVKPTTYASSYASQSRRTIRRQLPDGPGPLPDRYNLRKTTGENLRYVSPSSKSKTVDERRSTSYPSSFYTQQKTSQAERKVSNDSGYGSSSSVRYSNITNGKSTLAGRRSKSLSNLGAMRDLSLNNEPPENIHSFPNRTTILSYNSRSDHSPGISSKTKTLENVTQLDENANYYLTSTSTRHSSQAEDSRQHSLTNRYSSNYPSSNSSSYSKKGKMTDYSCDNRKEILTADTESLRRSSKGSTSSSSPSTPSGRGYRDGLVGLRNLGNTCFMNSVLQCLSHSVVLTDYLLKGSYSKQINSKSSMKGKLIQAYADLIKSMWKPGISDTAISPHSFKTQIQKFAPRFVGYNQQDAQEFLRFLLEGLHDDLNQVRDKPKYKVCEFNESLRDSEKAEKSWKHYIARDNSFITDVFVGQLKSTLKCTECGFKSVAFDPFWDLSLPIPRKSSSLYSSSYDSRSNVTIQDCMDLFTKEEVLDGDERPTCEKCKKKRKSTKQFTIQRFPKILVLRIFFMSSHVVCSTVLYIRTCTAVNYIDNINIRTSLNYYQDLKRFSGFGFRSKLQTAVEFPTDSRLNLKHYASDGTDCTSAVYGLYAVSNHSGTTYGGHYTAHCRHPISREWHCFNDSSVDGIPISRIGGSQAYILFYERVDTSSSL